ncbi:DinB family protein [Algoriphagus jejuensis]
MEKLAKRLESLVERGISYVQPSDQLALSQKTSPNKWSKKEILGHLIDSGINNLQRFNEIQFATKPYPIRPYDQDQLVRANYYQEASVDELCGFWKAINLRIQQVILRQTELTLAYPILLGSGETKDLAFLIRDYVDHLEHHLNQILDPFYPADPHLPIPQLLA